MTGFEYIFALFGLLLGLSLTEVLGGFGKALKSRSKVRIGWLTPVLGAFTAVELTAAWGSVWIARHSMPISIITLLTALVITGVYYLAATQVFPDQPSEWPDLDDYYDRHKRWVAGGLLAGTYLVMGAMALVRLDPLPGALMKIYTAIWTVLIVALILVRNRRINLVLILLLLAADLSLNGYNALTDPFGDNVEPAAVSQPAAPK
jgi:hypothetical protein